MNMQDGNRMTRVQEIPDWDRLYESRTISSRPRIESADHRELTPEINAHYFEACYSTVPEYATQ